jgi:hypothetical protein
MRRGWRKNERTPKAIKDSVVDRLLVLVCCSRRRLVGLASENVDIPPALDEGTTNAVHARGSIGLRSNIVWAKSHDLLRAALVGRSEGLVERREDKVGRRRMGVDSDLVKLTLDVEAEVVKVCERYET